MIRLVSTVSLILALGFAPAVMADPPHCDKGKPCGDSCIAKDKKCHIKPPKDCKTGKLCGDTCISKDKTCTK